MTEVAIVGRACRLPGAPSVDALWRLLHGGRCSVGFVPKDRWSQERFGHPRRGEPGRSYTWAAGVLDDIWGFDPGAFGISPREAEQMDPQQRLLLELVREALDDAGIPATSLAGKNVGVFVGASALDHGNSKLFDLAASDAYFATGNTLSLIANRISYTYDLHGPSMTIDTACSSSLVALHQAASAIRSGQIETAVVAGVNILASPFSFIGFSRAGMLSPTGLCHAFDDDADGYVRAEGGVVLVLRALPAAIAERNELRGVVVATGTNSDGRTVGVALPSARAQAELLARIYSQNNINPENLAFVEAHGTGTKVGDPAEAAAIGESLGSRRSRPLPIGSIKTNVGHLEPASGLAGVLKSMLALDHNLLPASLHCSSPNRDIPFESLNVAVATKGIPLSNERNQLAGVNSFGFGGTNAHAVIGRAPVPISSKRPRAQSSNWPVLLLSAHSDAALAETAIALGEQLAEADDATIHAVTATIAHRRDRLPVRAAVMVSDRERLLEALSDVADGAIEGNPDVATGKAISSSAPVAFVYSGNGSQWAGMGRAAFRHNAIFRDAFRAVDRSFRQLADWQLEDMLLSDALCDKIDLTSIAQPLIFAVQYATTQTLETMGLRPNVVLGHSVGEIAAAQAAGILSLDTAVRIIYARSTRQEMTRYLGRMAVAFADRDTVRGLIADHAEVEIAAYNSPGALTLAGPEQALRDVASRAKEAGIRVHFLDLDYPFHCRKMDILRDALLRDLRTIELSDERVRFVSTVDPTSKAPVLDAEYWWRNVREPVQFSDAVREAAELGETIFVEIGPRPTLMRHIIDTLAASGARTACIATLDKKDDGDPFRQIVGSALVRGARMSATDLAGTDPGPGVKLPAYPWQRRTFRLADTCEVLSVLDPPTFHPLIGSRISPDATQWRHHLDTLRAPALADHCVDGDAILPGAAFVEMMWAAARDWRGETQATIGDIELLHPMLLSNEITVEIRTTLSPATGMIEIASRPRLSAADWTLHARGKMFEPVSAVAISRNVVDETSAKHIDAAEIYDKAGNVGLDFGPAFRQAAQVLKYSETHVSVILDAADAAPGYALAPQHLDACFHGLIVLFEDNDDQVAYVPVKFGEVRLHKAGVPARADIRITQHDSHRIVADFTIWDATDATLADLTDVRFQPFRRDQRRAQSSEWMEKLVPIHALSAHGAALDGVTISDIFAGLELVDAANLQAAAGPDEMLLEGWALAATSRLAGALESNGVVDVASLVHEGHLSPHAAGWMTSLLRSLVAGGVAREESGIFKLDPDPGLPADSVVLEAFAREFPNCPAELLAASHTSVAIDRLMRRNGRISDAAAPHPQTMDAMVENGVGARRAASTAATMLRNLIDRTADGQMLRICLLGHGPLFASARDLALERSATLTLLDPNTRHLERARLSLQGIQPIKFASSLAELDLLGYDIILSAGRLHDFAGTPRTMQTLAGCLAPTGWLIAAETAPSLFRDLALSLGETLSEATGERAGGPKSVRQWGAMLVGFADCSASQATIEGGGIQVLAARGAALTPSSRIAARTVLIVASENERETASALEAELSKRGHAATVTAWDGSLDTACDNVVALGAARKSSAVQDRICDRLLDLRTLLMCRANAGGGNISIITRGARDHANSDIDVAEAAIWPFLRTSANEYSTLTLTTADVAPELSAALTASMVSDLIEADVSETELVLDADYTRAVRISGFSAASLRGPMRLTSERSKAGLDRLVWTSASRSAPGEGEIEIEVRATGLNFRDLMSAMQLLPDSILEDGFAGPTLGLECAGIVARVGDGVTHVRTGDHVIALTRDGFANYATVPASGVRAIPTGLDFAAAASMPVAFATAYYGLVTLAGIGPEDVVLLHGGAGGVGLAALQIARLRGATVIASAGSPAKRDLLHALGAHHVVDSRSLNFVDDIRKMYPKGVSVVLNSVAGEAMERSLSLVRPFGHFIELGKRDYVANTHIGLAPFRRNITYHGVDLDQLVIHRPALFATVMDAVIDGITSGDFAPILHRLYPATGLQDAFRAMRQSTHVGKLLISPPAVDDLPPLIVARGFDSQGTHLITGGLGGFGLKTAHWLADQGVRHLVLLGRNPPRDSALDDIASLRTAGVELNIVTCDVANADALRMVLKEVRRDMPPLRGIYHAAMVLHDATLATLTRQDAEEVLRPKVAGALGLERLTESDDLAYFVLFSSATTLIGNPGQAAYVAANGALEAIARSRFARGLPALAVSWGAIEDVGVLADNEALRKTLVDRVGIRPLTSRDALDALGRALDRSDTPPVLAIAPVNWGAARKHLPVLRSPTFALVAEAGIASRDEESERIELRQILAQSGREAAVELARNTVVEVISRVLRMPIEEIDIQRPLVELGIDSLMTIELGLMIENRLGEKIQLTASVGAISLSRLAVQIVDQIESSHGGGETVSAGTALLARHFRNISNDETERLKVAVASASSGLGTTAPSVGADAAE
jgi:phthiocerol/phenolphthiocerol synthesis type-I polyketide synthase C